MGTAAKILSTVKQYWGFEHLRPLQEEAIRAGLEGRDSLVVMPTGGGKSLCYQVPPAVAGRTDIVVSPLISLMKDQVDGLRACGYPVSATCRPTSSSTMPRCVTWPAYARSVPRLFGRCMGWACGSYTISPRPSSHASKPTPRHTASRSMS